jgi:recombination protein RecT
MAEDVKPSQNNVALKKFQEETVVKIQEQIQTLQEAGDLNIPANYSVGNQLKLAWLKILDTKDRNGNAAVDVCKRDSIANALLEMAIQGLSVYKKQCDFIVYGDKLTMQREYHGTIALARRLSNVGIPTGNVVYKNDDFAYEVDVLTGLKKITKHVQKLENIDPEQITGAYAIVPLENGTQYVEIMTMHQIKQAWMQGATKGQSPAHKNFPDQMAIKTVIGRACKLFISTSDDGGMMTGGDPENIDDNAPVNTTTKTTKAVKEDISITDAEIVADPPTQQQEEVKPEAKPESVKKETVKETVNKEPEAKPDGGLFPKEPQF